MKTGKHVLITLFLCFLFGKVYGGCVDYLLSGLNTVGDDAISASSFYGSGYEPWMGRLHTQSTGGDRGTWRANTNDRNQYIQVAFPSMYNLTAVATQEADGSSYYVIEYEVVYSVDGINWSNVSTSTNTLTFPGNDGSGTTPVLNTFSGQIQAKYIRIKPVSWNSAVAMRFDVIGCPSGDETQESMSCSEYLVSGPRGVSDMAFSASSYTGSAYEPWRARINSSTSWQASKHDLSQYIQVEFEDLSNITCITTSARGNYATFYVRSYYVQYSSDGKTWQTVNDSGTDKNMLFPGNTETALSETIKCLPTPLSTRYIRLVPVTWNSRISLRFDVLGCYNNNFVPTKEDLSTCLYESSPCSEYLVSGSRGVSDMAISATSYTTSGYEPWRSRINSSRSWQASQQDTNQYIQVEFEVPGIVTCITTSSRADNTQYHVRSYHVQYSNNGVTWETVTDSETGGNLLFPGNYDTKLAEAIRILPRPLYTRYIRLVPVTWAHKISLRFDVLGCYNTTFEPIKEDLSLCQYESMPCSEYLVSGPRGVPDMSLSASTYSFSGYEPWRTRINSTRSWQAAHNNMHQYIQVEFEVPGIVACITTSSRADNTQHHVRSYHVQYSNNGVTWETVTDSETGENLLFPGNYDTKLKEALSVLPQPLYTRYIRLVPVTWSGKISLRFDVLGCYNATFEPIPNDQTSCVYESMPCSEYLVSGPRGVSDMSLSASTYTVSAYEPWRARINSTRSWQASHHDMHQYIQVEFEIPGIVTCITTSSRADNTQHHVRSYHVQYSNNGETWETVTNSETGDNLVNGVNVKYTTYGGCSLYSCNGLFPGNYDIKLKEALSVLPEPLYTRYIRLVPVTWSGKISLRFDALGCYNTTFEPVQEDKASCGYESMPCSEYLVSGPRGVSDMSLSASTYTVSAYEPWRARINSTKSWQALHHDMHQYIQVEFEVPGIVTCITTSPRADNTHHHVRSYHVQYSNNGVMWETVTDSETGENLLFPGNYDTKLKEALSVLPEPLYTRYIRLVPVTWSGKISLRFDVLGCYNTTFEPIQEDKTSCVYENSPCSEYLVTGPKGVVDTNISASSYKVSYEPWRARRNSTTAWESIDNDINQYIQVDFEVPSIIACIVTSPRGNYEQYHVRSYYVQYSSDGKTWENIFNNDSAKIVLFPGNHNTKLTETIRMLPQPLVTQYIRLVPVTWSGKISLRFDVLGCHSTVEATTTEELTSTSSDLTTCSEATTLELTNVSAEPTTTSAATTVEPITTSPETTTASEEPAITTTQYTSNASCSCICVTILDINLTIGSPELNAKIDKLVLTTKVAKKETSNSIRSRTSVNDDRPSSKGLGSLGIAMLVGIAFSLLLIDLVNISTMIQSGVTFLIQQIIKKLNGCKRRL